MYKYIQRGSSSKSNYTTKVITTVYYDKTIDITTYVLSNKRFYKEDVTLVKRYKGKYLYKRRIYLKDITFLNIVNNLIEHKILQKGTN